MLELPDVTLFCFENHNHAKAEKLIRAVTERVRFGGVKWLRAHRTLEEFQHIEFDIGKQMKTSHALTIHLDGFVLHPESWNPEWLKYDYIGAPWPKDYLTQFNPAWTHRVGNSGFSLRSKRLCDMCHIIPRKAGVVVDLSVCQNFRAQFEKAGMIFAPPEVAAQFSQEMPTEFEVATPFGFHGIWRPQWGPKPIYYEPGICAKQQMSTITLLTLDGPQNHRTRFARTTWGKNVYVAGEKNLPRMAKEIGDTLGVPFVPDVFDLSLALPGEIFAYINNDVALAPGWQDLMLPDVEKHGCAFSQRIDLPRFRKMTLNQLNQHQSPFIGSDLFVFSKDWWRDRRENFPVVPFAYEGWDAVMTYLMLKSGFTRGPIVCYHEAHSSWWQRTRKQDTGAVKINRDRLEDWAHDNGLERYLGENDGYIWNRGIFFPDEDPIPHPSES